MGKTEFIDYYKLLQVHYDASFEVIKAAYLRLTKAYHPDSSKALPDGITALNEAYSVLKDAKLRTEYHKKWLAHYTGLSSTSRFVAQGVVPAEATYTAAKEALDLFFRYLCIKEWDGAYQLLTLPDRTRTSLEDFADWREAVALCSEIAAYDIRFSRTLHNCAIDGVTYSQVCEFNVTISEIDMVTGEAKSTTVKKCCVYDDISWHVWLGNSNVKAMALRFRLEAEHGKNIDSMAIYHNAVNRIDPLTGLLSEQGFITELEDEVERMKRYRTPVTLAAFYVRSFDREKDSVNLCRFACIVRDAKRRTDKAARLNNDIIICLLTDTRKFNGELAAKKFLKLVDKKPNVGYSVSYGIITFTGAESIHCAIKDVCEEAKKEF